MTTTLLSHYTEVKPVDHQAERWLNLLSGNAQRYGVNGSNGHYPINGVNGTAPFPVVRAEPLPQYWLRLLSGGRTYYGNGRRPVSTPLPAVDVKAEHWLKILAGK